MTDCRPLVLGIDIGSSNTGWSKARINTNGTFEILDSGCIRIPVQEAKYKGTQMVLKCMKMQQAIWDLCTLEPYAAVAVETPGGNTQSAAAAKALGACAVLVASIALLCPCTVLVKPSDVKKCISLTGSVTKDMVMDYVSAKYHVPNAPKSKGNYVKAYFEHIADSVVVLEAAIKTSKTFKGLISI